MPVTLLPSSRVSTDPNYAIDLVSDCLSAALHQGASDIHLQPRADHWEIRFRVDGVLQSAGQYPRSDDFDPVSRLMSLAHLPSYRAGVPLEGRMQWLDDHQQTREMRVGIFPTVHGNRAAIRILEDRASVRTLDQLGFDCTTQQTLVSLCEARDGWLLVAGPAGSGKTTTLYACLSHIASGRFQRSVLTIEDPIESVLDSICQSQLQASSGLTLAAAMRAAVRQDSEVLLVSEIRDEETAEAVLAASMTGHLCFSSIHAASLGVTLRRLVQMQLPIFAIQSGLRGVLCQRLLRKTCTSCRNQKQAGSTHICDTCQGIGYRGRMPISQIISLQGTSIGQSVFDALGQGHSALEIDSLISSAGIESLRDQASRLVQEGQTDEAEVFRVLGREH